jgi:hypothetical protein
MRLPRLSTSDWFLKAVVLCYEQPAVALDRMEKFSAHRGHVALLGKLGMQPGYFGRCPFSSRLVRGQSAELQREARSAAALLPLLAMEALQSRPQVAKSERRAARRRPGTRRRIATRQAA